MANNHIWSEVRLGDVCTKIGSGATPRGGEKVYIPCGIALIRSQNIYNDKFLTDGLAHVNEMHAEELKQVTVEEGDVLLNITGDSVARANQAPSSILPARVNQHVAIVRPNPLILDKRFLYYYLVSPQMQEYMLALASTGGTRPALTKGMIEAFRVPIPPLPEQGAIAHILGALDDKIELNRQMNRTLEAMAQAIFKSWFVDFDPVVAKAEGRQPYGMSAETAALFPEEFVGTGNDDFPIIPAGWELKALDDIAHYENGLALQKYRPTGDEFLPVIKIRELRQGYADESSEQASPDIRPSCIIDDGDMIFSWSGSLMIDLWCGGKGALNQHLFKVTSDTYSKWFYYFWTNYHLPDFQNIAEGKATTMGHIQRHHLEAATVVVPNTVIMGKADRIIHPLIETIIQNRLQSRSLARIRDTLLPKLLSGEIRLKTAEKVMENI
jgi:type I restriction enzyme S subunit